MSIPQLRGLKSQLNQLKHKAAPGRRITSVEREIGQIKRELNWRYRNADEHGKRPRFV